MRIDYSIEYIDEEHFYRHHLDLAIIEADAARKAYDAFCKRPEAFGKEYNNYQSYASRCRWADAVVKGCRNYNRGSESLDSFATHGGVNTPNYHTYLANKETK